MHWRSCFASGRQRHPCSGAERCYSAEMIDRRLFTGLLTAAILPACGPAFSQPVTTRPIKRARTAALEIAYEESGPETGFPVLLMHGFPYNPRCYDEVIPALVARGHRAIVPYLRGYGPTRFLSAEHVSLGSAGGGGEGSAGPDGCAPLAARGTGRVRLGRACGLCGRSLVARARPRSRGGQRLLHPEHRCLRGAGDAGAGASLLVSVLFPHRARPRRPAGEPRANCASFYGGCGRRTGSSTPLPTNARRGRSTIRISSTSSSTPTVTVSAMPRAIRRSKPSNSFWPRCRRFPRPQSCSTGRATGSIFLRRPRAAAVFHRALSAAIDPRHRAQCSPGSPRGNGRRSARTPLTGPYRHPRRSGIVCHEAT